MISLLLKIQKISVNLRILNDKGFTPVKLHNCFCVYKHGIYQPFNAWYSRKGHTYLKTNLQLKAVGLFRYVLSFSEH